MSEGKTPGKSGGGDASDPLDAALAAWPTAPADPAKSEEVASRVLSLLASGPSTPGAQASSAVSDEDLVRAPFPALPGEPQGSPAATEPRREGTGMTAESRERDRASFRDLARLASSAPSGPVSSPPSSRGPSSGVVTAAREENSGVIHLAALGGASVAPDPGPRAETRSSPAPAPAPPPGPEVVLATRKPPKRRRSWVAVSGLVAAAAVAAGVLVLARPTPRNDGTAAVAVVPAPAGSPVVGAAPAPAGIPVASAVGDDRGIDPASLPPASTAAVAARATAMGPASVAPRPAVPPPARTIGPAPVAEVATASAVTAAPAASGNLQALMQQAAGVTSAPVAPAATSPDTPPAAVGSVPLRPSQGALQGALGAVLPLARACLGPDDAISHAAITFGSDGSVVNVGVSGGAAGKPAEACIRAALMKARVAPFAQPTFTGSATVRPD